MRVTKRSERPTGQIAMFCAKPFYNRSLRVRVRVFRSYRTMHAWANQTGTTNRDWYAIFRPYTRRQYFSRRSKKRPRTVPEWGELLFTQQNIDMPDIVTHECVHAAIEFFRRERAPMDLTAINGWVSVAKQKKSTEERIALCVGFLVRVIVQRWDREKKRLGRV